MYAWIVSRSRVSRTGEKKMLRYCMFKKKKKTFFDHENKLQIKNEIRRKDGVGKKFIFGLVFTRSILSPRRFFFDFFFFLIRDFKNIFRIIFTRIF